MATRRRTNHPSSKPLGGEATYAEVISLIRGAQVVEELVRSLEAEPLELLAAICTAYEAEGNPVADHRLPIQGYLGDVSVRALVQAGLVDEKPGTRDFIRAFLPTQKGTEYYQRLKEEDYYSKK